MLPGEEDAADIPRGYTFVSLPRKPYRQTIRRGGGVALLIRDDIDFVKSHFSSPDILVLDLGFMWLIGAYIPPVTSYWPGWTHVEPFLQFWETVALCTQNEGKPIAAPTDINGRTGSVQPRLSVWPRTSADNKKQNTRGLAILDECDTYGLCILNGTSFESASPGRYTSRQPNGQSTIDLAMVSGGLIPFPLLRVSTWNVPHRTRRTTGPTTLGSA